MTASGFHVGAIVAVNAVGTAIIGKGPHFWAAPYERGTEFSGIGMPARIFEDGHAMLLKGDGPENTTIAIVATDARLTKAQCERVAVMAQDGMAHALRPAHAPMDGDVVFAAATGLAGEPSIRDLTEIGMLAADTLARAIARGVYEATALPFDGALPSWQERFGRR